MKRPAVEWGAATLALRGETESGDRHLVCALPGGVLLAAVDGIGHGREAALAADLAVRTLEEHAGEPLERALRRCHERLRPTRGVVMSLAAYDAAGRTLVWLGVGNVEALLLRGRSGVEREREWLLPSRGVVGGRMPALQPSTVPVKAGDLLILATDGIGAGFDRELNGLERPQELADRILARHGKRADDATVLVARFTGLGR
jgi:serine phosphatase RsbU (regulator of sigma subunit)